VGISTSPSTTYAGKIRLFLGRTGCIKFLLGFLDFDCTSVVGKCPRVNATWSFFASLSLDANQFSQLSIT
jgi:hypothetical protein